MPARRIVSTNPPTTQSTNLTPLTYHYKTHLTVIPKPHQESQLHTYATLWETSKPLCLPVLYYILKHFPQSQIPLNRTSIKLKVIRDTCLGYTVYRGSAPAKDIVKAAWIDFHDPDQNPLGYQRGFDAKRSNLARKYAESTPDAFWPESILAVRKDEDLLEEEQVESTFTPDTYSSGQYGTLEVIYTKDLTSDINGEVVPWRRAFSQVDCQHRLGSMGDSDESVTFCVIPGISRHQEATLFQVINKNQKGISTSLVDTIVLLTVPNPTNHMLWARDLDSDLASPFHRLVDTGGRGRKNTLITFRGLRNSLQQLIPPRYVDDGSIDYQQGYTFARNYWQAVHDEWPREFGDKKAYKMMVNPGVLALSRLGRLLFESKVDIQDFGKSSIATYLQMGKPNVDWSAAGPFKDATGKGAVKLVFDKLKEWFGTP